MAKRAKIDFTESLDKLTDTSQPSPISAVYALSNISPENLAKLQAAWQELDLARRQKIVADVADLVEADVELDFSDVLFFFLKDSDAKVRVTAIDALWEDESRQFLGELLRLMENDPDDTVREKATIGVGRFALLAELKKLPERWYDRIRNALLRQATAPNNPDVERRAIEGLGYFSNNAEVKNVIEKAYKSEDEHIKGAAIRAMGRNVDKRWLPEVGREMSNPEPALRYEAVTAAGEMGSDELLPLVIERSKDPDREVQIAAIWALGQIGGGEAKRTLDELSKNERPAIADAAVEALKELAYNDNPLNPLLGR